MSQPTPMLIELMNIVHTNNLIITTAATNIPWMVSSSGWLDRRRPSFLKMRWDLNADNVVCYDCKYYLNYLVRDGVHARIPAPENIVKNLRSAGLKEIGYKKVYGKLKIGITVATYLDFKLCIGMVRCAGNW